MFASHWHLYRDYGITDGVRYVVTGGGAERSTPEDEGGFCHYLLVRVRGDDVGWSVIRPGAILPPDAVTNDELTEVRAIKGAAWTAPLEVPRGDGVQLFLDEWEWGLTLTGSGPKVFLYRGSGREGKTVNRAVQLAVRRGGRRTVYETVFPASELTPLELAPGNSFRLCLVVNDLDPSVPDRPRHWLELTPGPGDGVPGAPMAKVVLAE